MTENNQYAPPLPDGYLPPYTAPQPAGVPEAAPVEAPLGGKVLTLPSGFKVALRNPNAIRNKERKFVFEGMADTEGDTMASKVALGFEMSARIVALLIAAWDVRAVDDALVPYGPVLPIPRLDMTGLDDLPMGDVSVLEKEADDARAIIMPDFTPSPNPASPTAPSAG